MFIGTQIELNDSTLSINLYKVEERKYDDMRVIKIYFEHKEGVDELKLMDIMLSGIKSAKVTLSIVQEFTMQIVNDSELILSDGVDLTILEAGGVQHPYSEVIGILTLIEHKEVADNVGHEGT